MNEQKFTEQELTELKEVFFTEANEIIQSLSQDVLNLENGQDREESLKNIQRHLHTFKGNSRALGFNCLNTLSHKSEDLLKQAGVAVTHHLAEIRYLANVPQPGDRVGIEVFTPHVEAANNFIRDRCAQKSNRGADPGVARNDDTRYAYFLRHAGRV